MTVMFDNCPLQTVQIVSMEVEVCLVVVNFLLHIPKLPISDCPLECSGLNVNQLG